MIPQGGRCIIVKKRWVRVEGTQGLPCVSSFIKMKRAGVAQSVERLICNQQVAGSSPTTSSRGEVPEWPKGADCKSAGVAFGGSNPPLSTKGGRGGGNSSAWLEHQPSKLRVAGSNPVSRSRRLHGPRSSVVERFLGKEEVIGSIPIVGSII